MLEGTALKESRHRAYRKYYLKNKNKFRAATRRYREKNKNLLNQLVKDRRKSDPLFRLETSIRSRIQQSLKGTYVSSSVYSYLGCSLIELKAYLELQFKEGMSWDNHSKNGWHVDHIIPLNTAVNKEELIKLNHYTNLRPLWASENFSRPKDGSDIEMKGN